MITKEQGKTVEQGLRIVWKFLHYVQGFPMFQIQCLYKTRVEYIWFWFVGQINYQILGKQWPF